MVRGPMIAEVTLGWAIANAIARWVIGRPAFSASGIGCSTTVELALVAEVLRHAAGPMGAGLLALAEAAGERALAERAPDQRAHPVALADRQHLAFDAPVDDRVRRLLGPEVLQAAPLGGPLRFDDLRGREARRTDRAHLAAVHQVGQGRQCLLHVDCRVGAVDLVEVEVIGLQAAQGVLGRGDDPAS